MPTRINRLWLPQNIGIQATFVLCEKCGEAYEADLKHICRRANSYPPSPNTIRVTFGMPKEVSGDA